MSQTSRTEGTGGSASSQPLWLINTGNGVDCQWGEELECVPGNSPSSGSSHAAVGACTPHVWDTVRAAQCSTSCAGVKMGGVWGHPSHSHSPNCGAAPTPQKREGEHRLGTRGVPSVMPSAGKGPPGMYRLPPRLCGPWARPPGFQLITCVYLGELQDCVSRLRHLPKVTG